MANRLPLDNVAHARLRATVRWGAQFGDSINQTLVVPHEFEDVQREYPIFVRKDQDGNWVAVALLGLDRGENLYLNGEQWDARYIPAVHRRGPFFLGSPGEGNASDLAVHVDLDDPRIGETEGDLLFKEHGGESAYLAHVTEALHTIHDGLMAGRNFYATLERFGPLQPVEIEGQIGGGTSYTIANLFTVGMQKFQALAATELEELHRAGYLAPLIFIRASLPNMNHLIDMKKRRMGQA